MIYLDSSAAVKLLHREEHSTELQAFLDENAGDTTASSALIEVELPRALRRSAPQALPRIDRFLQRLYRLDLDRQIRRLAAGLDDPMLRSLDAIHLATALILNRDSGGDLRYFVAYDSRLLDAAAAHDLPISRPGVRP